MTTRLRTIYPQTTFQKSPRLKVRMLDDYHDERGWDKKRGIPTKEKLYELGLSQYYAPKYQAME